MSNLEILTTSIYKIPPTTLLPVFDRKKITKGGLPLFDKEGPAGGQGEIFPCLQRGDVW